MPSATAFRSRDGSPGLAGVEVRRFNDPQKWVWSPEPVHEPLIPKWMYDEPAARRQANKGSRDGNQPNTHPQTRRTYVFRRMTAAGA